MKYTLFISILFIALVACKKEPGIGGDSEISGQVWSYQLNGSFNDTIAEYAAEDTYVYIVYGDNIGFDKRIKTDYNGMFRFQYLYPGDYTLYVYSFDPTAADGQSPVIVKAEIVDREQHLELDRIEILAQP